MNQPKKTAALPTFRRPDESTERKERVLNLDVLPFLLIHVAALAAFFTGVKASWIAACVGLYFLRMWAITVGYHRYFSHRSFKTSRVFQFILAFLATTSVQKGVLWWAGNHRHHHRHSDTENDVHSPRQSGFFWAHVGWLMSYKWDETRFDLMKDFAKYPELRWLNRNHWLPPLILAVLLFWAGGLGMLVWGFFVSTVLVYHCTFFINSLAHVFGKRRYNTSDDSRNSFILALLTLGEGWHNNHHHYQSSANQGWFWWEIDISFYSLKVLEKLGIVWDLRAPPDRAKFAHLEGDDGKVRQLRRTSRRRTEARENRDNESKTPAHAARNSSPSPA